MKQILRLALVCLLVFILANEPPRKQALAEVKGVSEVAPTIIVPTPTPTPTLEPTPVTPQEQAKATLKDLGQSDAWYAVEYIGFKESSWNPAAINYLGACGLFQALPCSKMNCELSDVPCQVRWATNYAIQRYGSWHNAYEVWLVQHWW